MRSLLLGFAFAVVALGSVPRPVAADVHAIPLPGLVGEYQAWESSAARTVTLALPGTAAEIRGASLRLRGSAETGRIICSGPFGPEGAVLLLDADFAVPAEPATWGRVKAAYR